MMLFHTYDIVFPIAVSVKRSKQWHTICFMKSYGEHFRVAFITRHYITSKDHITVHLVPSPVHLILLGNDKVVVTITIKIHHR